MKYVVWLNALMLWLAVISTRSATALLPKKCKKDLDCKAIAQTCHSLLKICVAKNGSLTVLGRQSRKTTCKTCLANEYCHPIFKTCLKTLTPPSTRNNKKPTAADCKHDRDCAKKKYCHKTFQKCLDIPVIPTMSTTKPSTQSCRNDSTCGKNRYCHGFFKICLERLTVFANVTTPPVKYNCTRDMDCHPGQYCRNVTNTCQQVRILKLSDSGLPSPPTKHGRCRTDSDCSRHEFCHQRISVAKTKKRRRKCSSGLRCSPSRRRHTGLGVCTTSMVALHPPTGSCSRDEDCGPAMCCLTKLGMCKHTSTKGDPCVTQPADFTCPCSANLFCKANPKKRKLKGKRLERKLDLSAHIHRELKKRGLVIHKKYMYGKCHKMSN